jgi:hypothetical protein
MKKAICYEETVLVLEAGDRLQLVMNVYEPLQHGYGRSGRLQAVTVADDPKTTRKVPAAPRYSLQRLEVGCKHL